VEGCGLKIGTLCFPTVGGPGKDWRTKGMDNRTEKQGRRRR
jgi:hypothetical protein